MSCVKKVLVFGMTQNYGGVESFILNYYKHINKKKIQFDFLAYSDNIAHCDDIKKWGGHIFAVTPRHKNALLNKIELKKFFKEHSSEYVALWCNLCEIANLDIFKYAKKYGIKKIIIHSHNSQSTRKGLVNILHKLNKGKCPKYATDFWACSKSAGKWFYSEDIISGENFKIINNAIDVSEFKFNEEIRDKKRNELGIANNFVVGHVGRFHFQKNHEFLIDIFKEIYERDSSAVLLLIGDGEDKDKINAKVIDMGLDDVVMFLGVHSDISKIAQAMDVFVLPSRFEGLGIVLIESQAAGLKCFTSANVVAEEAKVTNLLDFISLNSSPKFWADEVLKYKNGYKRNDVLAQIKRAGYDIRGEVEKLERFLLEQVK